MTISEHANIVAFYRSVQKEEIISNPPIIIEDRKIQVLRLPYSKEVYFSKKGAIYDNFYLVKILDTKDRKLHKIVALASKVAIKDRHTALLVPKNRLIHQ